MPTTVRDTARRGFTLVELLVVIAIISTLMGLLLPAVQSAREAGRRNTCMNNLKQIAMAIQQYDGSKGNIPGWRNAHPNSTVASSTTAASGALTYGAVSWPVLILPNIERRDVYSVFENANSSTGQIGVRAPAINIFKCPTSPTDDDTLPSIAYAGNMGVGVWNRQQSKYDSVMMDTLGVVGNATATLNYAPSRMNLDVVSSGDGTTMTALIAEKDSSAYSPQAYYDVAPPAATVAYSFQPAGYPATATGQPAGPIPAFGLPQDPAGSTPTPATGTMINSTTAANDGVWGRPSSNHPGGVLVAFCDGHTIFIRDSIDATTYCHLLTPNTVGARTGGATYAAMGGASTGSFNFVKPLSEGDFN